MSINCALKTRGLSWQYDGISLFLLTLCSSAVRIRNYSCWSVPMWHHFKITLDWMKIFPFSFFNWMLRFSRYPDLSGRAVSYKKDIWFMNMIKIKNASNKRPKWGKKLIRMAKDELDSTLCCGAPQCRRVEMCISDKTAFSVGMFLQSPPNFLFLFMVLLDGAAAHWMCSSLHHSHKRPWRRVKTDRALTAC